mmetsp:Transcript_2157/g.4421  ORF Transcript_2157/g.4421 Transcript_2157/m.4421 type:complete len:236 (+) Transcript_2157:1858-2565(+)
MPGAPSAGRDSPPLRRPPVGPAVLGLVADGPPLPVVPALVRIALTVRHRLVLLALGRLGRLRLRLDQHGPGGQVHLVVLALGPGVAELVPCVPLELGEGVEVVHPLRHRAERHLPVHQELVPRVVGARRVDVYRRSVVEAAPLPPVGEHEVPCVRPRAAGLVPLRLPFPHFSPRSTPLSEFFGLWDVAKPSCWYAFALLASDTLYSLARSLIVYEPSENPGLTTREPLRTFVWRL